MAEKKMLNEGAEFSAAKRGWQKTESWPMVNPLSPHLKLAGARGRQRPRTAARRPPGAVGDTPEHVRRVPLAATTVTAISAISPPGNGRTGSNPI